MYIMRTVLFLVSIVFNIVGTATANEVFNRCDTLPSAQMDLFTYGSPSIGTSEMNFRNLFRNFPIYVDNANEIKLLYSHYVETIKNKKQIKSYVKRNFPPYVPNWGVAGSQGGNSDIGEFSTWRFTIEQDPFQTIDEDIVSKMMREVKIGYEVWEVVFKLWDTTYHYYMFVNAKTQAIVKWGNIFGANIPQSHIDFINRKYKRDAKKHIEVVPILHHQ